MDFEEYVSANYKRLEGQTRELVEDAFKAGQQSKQAEIEGLEKKLKYEKSAYRNIKLQFLNKQDDLDELQKAWQHQQTIINDLQKTIVSLEAGLRKNSSNKQKLLSKNIELQKRIDEYEKLATSIRNQFDDLG